MSYPTLSFKQLLHSFARDVGRRPEALTTDEEAQFAHRLSDAVDWAWHYLTDWSLPEQLEGDTITLGAEGVIATEDLDYARVWSVWSEDPRTKETEVTRLNAVELAGGDVKVFGKAAGDTVYVIWRARAPEFTAEVFDETTEYDFNALVWDKEGDAPDVFRCIDEAGSDAEPCSNADVWQAVRLPKIYQKAVHLQAVAEQARLDDDKPARAQQMLTDAEAEIQTVALRIRGDASAKPWLNNHNI